MTSSDSIAPKFLTPRDHIGVVAAGFSGGQLKPGVEAGPKHLVDAGLIDQLRDELKFTVFWDEQFHGYHEVVPPATFDDSKHHDMIRPYTVSAVTQRLCQQVYDHAKEGRLVLTLGGDHSIAMGSIAGVAKAVRERHRGQELAVIWVDAHGDINTPATSGSKNMHGMPVAFLSGLAKAPSFAEAGVEPLPTADGTQLAAPFGWLRPEEHYINLRKLVYIGLRDVDRGEKKIIRDNGIKAFSMHDIDRHGIGRVMEMALAHIGADTPIHLSFDVDALDPAWAPATGTPVRGGLTLREGDYIAECVHATGSLVGIDLVEVNPSLDPAGAEATVNAGLSILRCALGDTLL